jgi:hypothetical protein
MDGHLRVPGVITWHTQFLPELAGQPIPAMGGAITLQPGEHLPLCLMCWLAGMPACHPSLACPFLTHGYAHVPRQGATIELDLDPSPRCFYCQAVGHLCWDGVNDTTNVSLAGAHLPPGSLAPSAEYLHHDFLWCHLAKQLEPCRLDRFGKYSALQVWFNRSLELPWPLGDEIVRVCPNATGAAAETFE